jgi:hypothetical protein
MSDVPIFDFMLLNRRSRPAKANTYLTAGCGDTIFSRLVRRFFGPRQAAAL